MQRPRRVRLRTAGRAARGQSLVAAGRGQSKSPRPRCRLGSARCSVKHTPSPRMFSSATAEAGARSSRRSSSLRSSRRSSAAWACRRLRPIRLRLVRRRRTSSSSSTPSGTRLPADRALTGGAGGERARPSAVGAPAGRLLPSRELARGGPARRDVRDPRAPSTPAGPGGGWRWPRRALVFPVHWRVANEMSPAANWRCLRRRPRRNRRAASRASRTRWRSRRKPSVLVKQVHRGNP